MVYNMEVLLSKVMDYVDIEFENAVRVVFDRWRAFKAAPDDKVTQGELCRALRSAKLLYKDICHQYGKRYMGGAERLRGVVEEIGGLLVESRNSSDFSHSIRRQLKEIREAC